MNFEEEWELMSKEFDAKKIIQIYGIAIMIRFAIEKERIKERVKKNKAISYSVLHTKLHYESVKTDIKSFNLSLIELLDDLPEKYNTLEIRKKILNEIPLESQNFFNIKDNDNILYQSDKKKLILKIKDFEIISFKPWFYLYFAKDINEEEYLFLFEQKLKKGHYYELEMEKDKIINDIPFYYVKKKIDKSQELKEEILKEYGISNEMDFFDDSKGDFWSSSWPVNYTLMKERKIFLDVISCFANNFKRIEDPNQIFPFLQSPYTTYWGEKIGKDNIEFMLKKSPKRNSYFKTLYEAKEKMDKKNLCFVKTDLKELKKYTTNFGIDIKEEEEEENEIFFKEYYDDYKMFEKIFKEKIEKNELYSSEKDTFSKILNKICSNKITILIGPAGHGKTSYLKNIMERYAKENKNVKLICETWKALKNYEDKFANSTIAGIDKQENFFDNIDLLVIDEISVISNWKFLKYVKKNTRIVFCGDINQLKPIYSKINKINWLIKFGEKNIFDLKEETNFRLNEIENTEVVEIQKKILSEGIDHFKPNYGIEYLSSKESIFNSLKNWSEEKYLIITERNGGIFGTHFLNLFFSKGETFKIGDKIVFTKKGKDEYGKYYNGLFGKIKKIESEFYYIESIENNEEIMVRFGDRLPFNHIYAMTAHKAQGTTIERVVVLCKEENTKKDWLYTAYSRASKDSKIIFIRKTIS